MPNVDGLEATRRIRQKEQADSNQQPVYIIAMTANTQDDDRAFCFEEGMDDFISKPVQLKELQRALNKSLGLQAEPPANAHDITLLDESQLDQLRVNGNDDMLREIVSLYLTDTCHQINSLSNEQNSDTVARTAHQLKGSSANLGARQLADALSRLEEIARTEDIKRTSELLEEIRGTFDRTAVKLNSLLKQ